MRRHRFLKWYFQSYLMGVASVICGFRDDEGTVHQLERYSLDDLVRLAHQDSKRGMWVSAAGGGKARAPASDSLFARCAAP